MEHADVCGRSMYGGGGGGGGDDDDDDNSHEFIPLALQQMHISLA